MVEKDIATFLDTLGYGTLGTDIFYGDTPPEPDNCVIVAEYAGKPSGIANGLDYPSVQVKVRNSDYLDGKVIANNIRESLHTTTNQAILDGWYLSIFANQSGATAIGKDLNNRQEFTINFNLIKRR